LFLVGFEGEQHLGMAHRNAPLFEKRLSVRLEVQKPHGVCYRGAALANALGDVVLSQAEIAVEPFVGAGLFDGIEIFALEIFNQREFKHLPVACLTDDGRGLSEAKFPRSAPSTFPGDEFVFVTDLSNDEGLDDAAFANAFDQFLQVLATKFLPWLKGAWRDLIQRQRLNAFAEFFDGCGSGDASIDQRAEAFAKCGFCHGRKWDWAGWPELTK